MIEKEFFSYVCSKRFCSFSQFFDKSLQDLTINSFHLNKTQPFPNNCFHKNVENRQLLFLMLASNPFPNTNFAPHKPC